MIHRLPLRYIRLGVFTSTPQLQSLRLSSDYTYLTDFLLVRVLPLISYFSHMHYYIIVLYSCVVTTVFDLLERCISLVLRLALLGS